MKVLILHHHFNTPQKGGALRSYYLAKALVDRGIQTIVITTHNGKDKKSEMVEGIEVHYLPISYHNKYGFYERVRSFLRYVFSAVAMAGPIRDVSVCYTISAPLTIGIASLWIKARYKIPFIFDVGDLWPDAPVQLGFIRNYFLKRSLYALEKRVYQQAESVVALSPAIQSAIEKKVPQKKIHLIPNMADTEFFNPSAKDRAVERRFNAEKKFVVSYIGALGYANGLDYYLECARACQKAALPVRFLLCGAGAMLDHLQRTATQLQLYNLLFIPFQNREGVRDVLNITDAVFICYRPVPILETGSPNKYFDGLAAGKLIVVNFDGWIREEIERERCGFFVDPRHPASFVEAVKPFMKSPSLLTEHQQASRALAEKKYSRKMLSKAFVSSIKF